MLATVTKPTRQILMMVAGVIVLIFFSKCGDYIMVRQSKENRVGLALLLQAREWYLTSGQDGSPVSALQHANFSIAYLHAARYACRDVILERLSGVDVQGLSKAIENQQQKTLLALQKTCPKIKSKHFAVEPSAWSDH